ncbi:DUF4238 domain-containing protein [Pacificibacter marinus]|uniref:DUF4238 domain-containing protein n=1 Tax=Pacificibacter marinus TaxID=658057 RepID=UPI001C06BEB8|nr:DUF4238 domain-containing protein [Pacificibacter marinus]MBU2866797.1 DUF4238 domain-containing protein [Pacificibacter marinus]
MSEPIYHHYISNFYLKQFARPAGKKSFKIHEFDKLLGKISPKKRTSETGGKDHFNKSFSKTDPNDIEKIYARKIETPAGAALKRILDAKAITSEVDLNDVLLFFAMTTARNPKRRSQNEDPMRKLDGLLIRSALGEDGASILEQRVSRDLLSEEHVEMELSQILPIFQSLTSKSWTLLESEGGEFITSDDPLQIIHANEAPPWGFKSNGAVLYAPLSAEFAIMGLSNKVGPPKMPFSKRHVAGLNLQTVLSAHHYVYYKSDNFYIVEDSLNKVTRWSENMANRYIEKLDFDAHGNSSAI